MANSYNNTITPHTQKSAVDGVPDQQSASINPFALLGLGAALNLVEKEEAIADFTASAIASAMCVKFGAIVLRQDMKSEKHVFGQLNNAPIKSEVAQEIQSFLSNSPVTTQTIGLEFCNEITVNRETLPELSCHGLRRLLLLRLRTLDNDYGMILAGKGNNKSFTAVQRAALQALGSETSLALHRLQLNEERAANETALRESENRFRLLVERAGDAIFLINLDGRFVDVNERACKNLGYTREELLTKSVWDIAIGLSPEKLETIWAQMEPDVPITLEGTHRRKDGTTFPVEVRVCSFELDNRQHTLCLARDITERKQAEEELRTSEERFRSLYNNHTPVMMHLVDWDGNLVNVNDYWLEVLGYERGEVIGRKSTDFLTEESRRHAIEVAMPEFLKTGFAKDVEYHMVKKNGEVIDVLLSAIADRDREGRINYSLAFIVDVTERKKAEKALRESEERFHKIFDHSNDSVFVIDPKKDKILDANSKASKMLGYSRKELLSMPISAIHPNEMAKFLHFTQSVFKKGSGWTDELTCLTKSGSRLPAEISASVIELGGEKYVLALVRDITVRKKAEQALRESEDRLSRILESAMDAIITIDQEKRIVLFNQAAEKVFRCPSAEAIGQPLDRYLSESLRNLVTDSMKALARRRKSKGYMWAPEGLIALRADGEEFPIEATISQVEVSGQKLYTVILRDINERQKAEAELNKLQLQNIYLQEEIRTEYNFGEIVGDSAAMKEVFQNIERVAATDSTVLLTGETGTGKELIAHAIHNLSSRKDNVLVKVNCGALPSGLVESELFGHEKGAFTGATTGKKGRFELADSGTIFLDEVGELPLETQTKLLRVLQEQEFERVGGTQTLKVNVRVIAATNHNLEEAVKHGAFRADLFYRLNIFPVHIPALRDRIDDIPLLINYFVRKFSGRIGKRIESLSSETLEKLISYDWPGNVRELANILERAVILCDGGVLRPEHIGISIPRSVAEEGVSTLEDAERQHIMRALEKTGGVVGGPKGAATLLGINRSTLLSRMKKLGIDKTR